MKRSLLCSLLALCLLLSGCSAWMDGSYVSVTPHQEDSAGLEDKIVAVASYLDIRRALQEMVLNGREKGILSVADCDKELLEKNLSMARRYVMNDTPIGAYAVEEIVYDHGKNRGKPAVAVSITYLHDRADILRIRRAKGMEEAKAQIYSALDRCEPSLVLRVEQFQRMDIAQIVQDYCEAHPDRVIEIPQFTVNMYPDLGPDRLLEMKFTYQTSRKRLLSMQAEVRPIFESADLYVSGDRGDSEKLSQLSAFLMERHDYVVDTSITPSYSLLCHGVGDSKAFARVYAAMCRRAGLSCQVVYGAHNGEPWAWNILCDNGVYRHVDLLDCAAQGGFQTKTDREMAGYVWDYSAYPACE